MDLRDSTRQGEHALTLSAQYAMEHMTTLRSTLGDLRDRWETLADHEVEAHLDSLYESAIKTCRMLEITMREADRPQRTPE